MRINLVCLILAFISPLKSSPVTTRQATEVKDNSSNSKPLANAHIFHIKNYVDKLDPTWISQTEKARDITTPGSMKSEEASIITDINKDKPSTNTELNATLKPSDGFIELNTQNTFQDALKHHELESKNYNDENLSIGNKPVSSNIPESSAENKELTTAANLTETLIKGIQKRQVNTIATNLENNVNIKTAPDNKTVSTDASTDSVSEHGNHTDVGYSDTGNKMIHDHELAITIAKFVRELSKLYPVLRLKASSMPILNVTAVTSDKIVKYSHHDEVAIKNDQNTNKTVSADGNANSVSQDENYTSVAYSEAVNKKVRRNEREMASHEIIEKILNKSDGFVSDHKTASTTSSTTPFLNVTEFTSDKTVNYSHHDEVIIKNVLKINKTGSIDTSSNTSILNVTEVASSMKYRHSDEVVENDQKINKTISSDPSTDSVNQHENHSAVNFTEAEHKIVRRHVEENLNKSDGFTLDHKTPPTTSSSTPILDMNGIASSMKYRHHDKVIIKNDQNINGSVFTDASADSVSEKENPTAVDYSENKKRLQEEEEVSDKRIEENPKSGGFILDHKTEPTTSFNTPFPNVTEVASDKTVKYRHHDEILVKTDANAHLSIDEATNLKSSTDSRYFNSGISSEYHN